MVAIAGIDYSRRAEHLALLVTALGVLATAVVPVLYVIALPTVCLAAAALAPAGRRVVSAMAVWVPISLGVLLGVTPGF